MSAQGVATGRCSVPHAAGALVMPAGLRSPGALGRRRRPAPPGVPATLVRLLLFAGLCVTGSALFALLDDGSASAAPSVPGQSAAHRVRSAHATAGILDGVGQLTRSVLDPAAGPARATHHPRTTARHHTRSAGARVVASLVDSVRTGRGSSAAAPKPPASHHKRPCHHADRGDGIGETAMTGITAADRAVASVARTIEPVTAALTTPLAPLVGDVVTPHGPVIRPAGQLLTATGLVPVRGASSRPPGSVAGASHHQATASVASLPRGQQTFDVVPASPGVVAGIDRIDGTGGAPGADAPRSGDRPADQPAPFWPLGVPLPAAGTNSSSNTVSSGAGGNVAAGYAERVGAVPWPRVNGIARSLDDIARQLDAGKPQVSPD